MTKTASDWSFERGLNIVITASRNIVYETVINEAEPLEILRFSEVIFRAVPSGDHRGACHRSKI